MTIPPFNVLNAHGPWSGSLDIMIVANVVPRPPRSSYNLLNLRETAPYWYRLRMSVSA